jgi:hypothetical protein
LDIPSCSTSNTGFPYILRTDGAFECDPWVSSFTDALLIESETISFMANTFFVALATPEELLVTPAILLSTLEECQGALAESSPG